MDDVERAFREAHGQAVATLTRIFGDITLAEDAVQDAFVTAVDRWPRDGVPDNPAGWIVTTARNRAVDVVRRGRRGRQLTEQIATDRLRAESTAGPEESSARPDDQLRLIFTCCHPAIRVEHQVALTLRLIAGLTPAEVAAAFLVSEETMAKRLVRAKYKIKAAQHPVPSARRRRPATPSACGALGAVPDLQRRRRRRQAPRPASRGDLADPSAGGADARRAGGGGSAGPHAAQRRPDAGPRRRSPGRAAEGPGPVAVGSLPDRRGAGAGAGLHATSPARARSSCKRRSRRCTAPPAATRRRTGQRSSGSTTG